MPKIIEGLELKDLKQAFSEYLDEQLTPTKLKRAEWIKFWKRLEAKCSVVDRWP